MVARTPPLIPDWEIRLHRLAASVTAAAVSYEARWTLAALARTDADLHDRLKRQIDLWQEASRSGDGAEIEAQGEALVRGYRRAVEAMDGAQAPDDAYLIGRDAGSGRVVAIGSQLAAVGRVAALYPEAEFWTPDELAAVLGDPDAIRGVSAVKRAFPGALVTDYRA